MEASLMVREFNQVHVGQSPKDGYIDATAMCRSASIGPIIGARRGHGALPRPSTAIGIPINELIQSHRGAPETGGGTWGHPRIAIHLAMWCSPQFAVQVTAWVEEWYRTKDNPLAKHGKRSLPVLAMRDEEIRTALSKFGSRIAAAEGQDFWDFWDGMHLAHYGETASTIKRVARSYPKTHPVRAGVKGWNQMSARKLIWYLRRSASLTESLELDLRRCDMEATEARMIALTEGLALVNRLLSAGITPGMFSEENATTEGI
jgi:hypothetical protein